MSSPSLPAPAESSRLLELIEATPPASKALSSSGFSWPTAAYYPSKVSEGLQRPASGRGVRRGNDYVKQRPVSVEVNGNDVTTVDADIHFIEEDEEEDNNSTLNRTHRETAM